MGNEALNLRTDPELLEALQKSLARKPTVKDIQEQRVSFVYGSLGSKSNMTREQVRKLLVEQDGLEVA
jgi:hypothetical protein